MRLEQTPRCDPSFLGPLTDDPVVPTEPVRVFEGEERFLSTTKLAERDRMWREAAPHLERALDDDETVLYFLPALHVPGIFQQLGFGVWWSFFYRSVLVLTDRRMVEISMRDWKTAGTCVCSYPWAQVKKLKLSMGTLKLAPASGRTQKWKLPVRGDRLDRDLDLSANSIGWSGGHDPNTWTFGADPDQRSEWLREDGPALFVFSMPIAETTHELEVALQQDGEQTETKLFAGFECIKSVGESTDEDGNPILWARWFLFDRETSDLHVIVASVWPEDLEDLEPDVESALLSATWIPVVMRRR